MQSASGTGREGPCTQLNVGGQAQPLLLNAGGSGGTGCAQGQGGPVEPAAWVGNHGEMAVRIMGGGTPTAPEQTPHPAPLHPKGRDENNREPMFGKR